MALERILIIGSSARAAAHSAQRAGLQPLAIDQFNDRDLVSICPAKPITNYPGDILEIAREFPSCPFVYTGAIENYPDIVATLSRERPLLGNGADTLQAV